MTKIRPDSLCLGLLDSIHKIDIRMDEIRIMMARAPNKVERRVEIKQRLIVLEDTRSKLLESLSRTIKDYPNSLLAKQIESGKQVVLCNQSAYANILRELQL